LGILRVLTIGFGAAADVRGSQAILLGPLHLPGIAPHDIDVYAVLRECHNLFAFLLFLTFTAHIRAVLFHTLVLRDRLIDRMALWPTKPASPQQDETQV
jgi:cytochrome b561